MDFEMRTAVESILEGDNALVVQSKLMAFLAPEERDPHSSE